MANVSKEASALNSALGSFGGAGGIALAAATGLATIATAATGLARHYADVAEQVLNLSAVSGVSATNIQVLQRATINAGGSAEEAGLAIRRLAVAVTSNRDALAAHNITARDSWGALLQVADAMKNTTNGAERAALATAALGRGNAALTAVLAQGSTALLKYKEQIVGMNAVLTPEQLDKFSQLDARLDQLNNTMETMKVLLASAIVPFLLKMFEVVEAVRIRAALLVPTLILLNDTIDALSEKFNNAFGGSKSHEAMDRVRADAMAIVEAVKKANQEMLDAKAFAAMFKWLGQGDNSPPPSPQSDPGAMARWLGRSAPGENFGSFVPGGGPGRQAFEVGPMVDKAKEKLISFRDLMGQVAHDIVQSFAIIGQSLGNSILGVFVNLTNRAQTFRSAIVQVFNGVRDGVLQAIGEIVAASVTKAFLKILGIVLTTLTGNPFFGLAGGADPGGFNSPLTSGGGGSGPLSAWAAGNASLGAGSGGGVTNNNFVIQTLSAKDLLSSLVSPTGSLRSANSRLSEVAAVS